ncbi:hypothetical protein GQ600_14387 [Phytophthora cactorum]|nr:hypothetical protein GQ600_14387 [Phytophthora cactorum]
MEVLSKDRVGYLRSYWVDASSYSLFGPEEKLHCLLAVWPALRPNIRVCSLLGCMREHDIVSTWSEQLPARYTAVLAPRSGLMSDVFLLITQEGPVGQVQCISLGYNLAGLLLMLFEMVELDGEKVRILVKRLLFTMKQPWSENSSPQLRPTRIETPSHVEILYAPR